MLLWLLLGIAETRSLKVCSSDGACSSRIDSLDEAISLCNTESGKYTIQIEGDEYDISFPQSIDCGSVTITGESRYTLPVNRYCSVHAPLTLENANIVFRDSSYSISIDSGASVTFSSCVLGYSYDSSDGSVQVEALQADGILISSGSMYVDSSSS